MYGCRSNNPDLFLQLIWWWLFLLLLSFLVLLDLGKFVSVQRSRPLNLLLQAQIIGSWLVVVLLSFGTCNKSVFYSLLTLSLLNFKLAQNSKGSRSFSFLQRNCLVSSWKLNTLPRFITWTSSSVHTRARLTLETTSFNTLSKCWPGALLTQVFILSIH